MTSFQTKNLPEQDQQAIPGICVLAAMADGSQSDLEREEIKRLINQFADEGLDIREAYQETLAGRASMPKLVGQIQSHEGKQLAYEMAVCICNVDEALSKSEQQFLSNLHRALGLDVSSTQSMQDNAAALGAASLGASALAQPPILANANTSFMRKPETTEVDDIITNRPILAGALEVMPHNLATMAIITLQMQLDLELTHDLEFLATIGVGMTSQVVESYLSRLVRGATKRFAGKMIGSLAGQATESAIAFATTYAIGQAAKSYYASGRTLSMDQLREIFSRMLDQGRNLRTQYSGEIAQRSSQLNVSDLLALGTK